MVLLRQLVSIPANISHCSVKLAIPLSLASATEPSEVDPLLVSPKHFLLPELLSKKVGLDAVLLLVYFEWNPPSKLLHKINSR